MLEKHILITILFLLAANTMLLAFEIKPARAQETIYINADGSIAPSTDLIATSDNVTYALMDDINESIVVERSNIVLDGASHMVQGSGSGNGLDIESVSNVTVENVSVNNFYIGFLLNASSNDVLHDNYASSCTTAIYLSNSSNNTLYKNTVIRNYQGILLDASGNNTLSDNDVVQNPRLGIELDSSSSNALLNNTVSENAGIGGTGIYLSSSSSNILSNNNATANYWNIVLDSSSGNVLSQNEFSSGVRSNFGVYGSALGDYVNWVDNSNLDDGKPIYYYVKQNGLLIDPATHPSIGYLALVNCVNITVKNLNLSNKNREALLLGYTDNSILTQNTILNNDFGFYIYSSTNNTLSDNNVTGATQYADTGITLDSSYNNTIIHSTIVGNGGGIHIYTSSGNVAASNNVTGNPGGIGLMFSSNNRVMDNIVAACSSWGISLMVSNNNSVSGNDITKISYDGITLYTSSNDTLTGNNITETHRDGIYLFSSTSNQVYYNNVVNNSIGVFLDDSINNMIYLNNFINNTQQVSLTSSNPNTWDSGYPSGGNYWSDYTGLDLYSSLYQNDTGSDGLGDTPYVVDSNNSDRYPLMGQISSFDAEALNRTVYNIKIISNSTISDVLIGVVDRTISFNVTGANATRGFCRVTIPNVMVQDFWHGNYMVLLNNEQWPSADWSDGSNIYIYINYTHSEYKVIIIPEFPYDLTIFFFATFLTVVFMKKSLKTHFKSE